jgi:hypothetical protein
VGDSRPTPCRPAGSPDVDHVRVVGSLLEDTEVQVEISYREAVIAELDLVRIGRASGAT